MRWFTTLAFLLSAAAASGQPAPAPADPKVDIVAPEADAYLSGLTLLRASVDPPDAVKSVTFFVDDQTEAAREARVQAVEDARTKAEELASASGLTLGPVIAISEGIAGGYVPVYGRAMGGGMGAAADSVPVETGSTTVAVDVTITFELQ